MKITIEPATRFQRLNHISDNADSTLPDVEFKIAATKLGVKNELQLLPCQTWIVGTTLSALADVYRKSVASKTGSDGRFLGETQAKVGSPVLLSSTSVSLAVTVVINA